MRALVTGAAGFIGSNLVDGLLAEGYQVVGIDNFCTGIAANLEHAYSYNHHSPSRFTLVKADIQAPELIGIVAGANPDVIFHIVAQVDLDTSVSDPRFDARNNVPGTINICEAGRGNVSARLRPNVRPGTDLPSVKQTSTDRVRIRTALRV